MRNLFVDREGPRERHVFIQVREISNLRIEASIVADAIERRAGALQRKRPGAVGDEEVVRGGIELAAVDSAASRCRR